MAFSLIHSGPMPERREAADVVAKPAFFRDRGRDGQNTRIVDAGAEVEHRRDADGLAYLAKTLARIFHAIFRGHVTCLGRGMGGAAGLDHQHVVLYQFARKEIMQAVLA